MWVQQLNKIGFISLNKLGTMENVAGLLTRHVQEQHSTSWQEGWVTHFLMKKLKSFKSTRASMKNYWDQKLAAIEGLLVFDDGENE